MPSEKCGTTRCMKKMFAEVKVLVWDFDGTFYRPNPELWHEIREAEYQVIADHTGWPKEKVIREFSSLHKKVYQSATQVASTLAGISPSQAAVEMEEYFDRRKYLTRDKKLITLFKKLKTYRHCILANGVITHYKETLRVLGVSPDIFELIVTSETVGKTKPDSAGFLYILNHTKLPAYQHLMIGDRESSDIIPARDVGMKTCLVWCDTKSRIADTTLASVYDVEAVV